MAPEQCDDGTIDARTDVYALGVMAFELFTGRLPFPPGSTTQLLLAHLWKPPPRPSSIVPIDPALERAILRALEKEPGAAVPGHGRARGGAPAGPPAAHGAGRPATARAGPRSPPPPTAAAAPAAGPGGCATAAARPLAELAATLCGPRAGRPAGSRWSS